MSERASLIVPQLIVAHEMRAIDFDQTAGDTELCFDKTARLAVGAGIVTKSVIYDAKAQMEASGGSFDTMGFLAEKGASPSELDDLQKVFAANKEGDKLLYADTVPYLTVLRDLNIPNLFTTYGSVATQAPKLQAVSQELSAAGFTDYPSLITNIKQKGRLIRSWEQPEGFYSVEASNGTVIRGKTGVLDDDKSLSFDQLPEDWTGNKVKRLLIEKESQKGPIPQRVVVVSGLAEVTETLKRAYNY